MAAALLGVLALVAVLAAAAVCGARGRRELDRRVAEAAGRIAGEWASRAELAALLDPDELLEHALGEVAALPGVDAALAVLDEADGRRTIGLGLSDEEAQRIALETPHSPN